MAAAEGSGGLLTRKFVNGLIDLHMVTLEVIEDPAAAMAALDPIRSRLLSELGEPASAATLAGRLDMPRQKIHYHLCALEAHGLVEVAEKRKWGGLTERLLVASAASYMVAPAAMGAAATDPGRTRDVLSASYLIALAARVVQEVKALLGKSEKLDKRLPTLSVDTEIRFRSPAERAAFSRELTEQIARLAARYHDAAAPGGRPHRVVVFGYPTPRPNTTKESA
jgi:DNA-binding transcriptional ArsR family regulator